MGDFNYQDLNQIYYLNNYQGLKEIDSFNYWGLEKN